MAREESPCPDCRAERRRSLWCSGLDLLIAFAAMLGLGAFGLAGLCALDGFAFEGVADPAAAWRRMQLWAAAPWVAVAALSALRARVARRVRATATPREGHYRSATLDARCEEHSGPE